MIKFRQKNYGLPLAALGSGLLNTAMIGSSVIGVKQASDQAKQAESQHQEMLEAQQRENAKLTNALNNLAKEAKNNPQIAAQAGHMVGESKMFAIPAGYLKHGKRFIGDVVKAAGGTGKIGKAVLGLGSAGVATAAVNYGVNKVQTADARRIGMIPKKSAEQRSYAVSSSVMSKAGTYAKKAGKFLASKENLKQSASWAAIGLLPAVGYLGDRAQFKSQVRKQESMPQQRSYAVNMSTIAKGIKGYAKHLNPKTWQITKTPGQTLSGFAARSGSMFMIGRKEVADFGKKLATDPKAGKQARKFGKWIVKNPVKANLGVGLAGGSVLTAAYGKSEKLTDKALRKIDKDAYSYEKQKNQQVQQ